MIAVSYFPDWRVLGAARVYFLTPGYIAVYPYRQEVLLYHGKGVIGWIAEALTLLGVVLMVLPVVRILRRAGSKKTVGNED